MDNPRDGDKPLYGARGGSTGKAGDIADADNGSAAVANPARSGLTGAEETLCRQMPGHRPPAGAKAELAAAQSPAQGPRRKKRKRKRGRKVYAPQAIERSLLDLPEHANAVAPATNEQTAEAGRTALHPSSIPPDPTGGREGGGGRRAKVAARRQAPGGRVYAALDLGTNNCRLLVAVPTRPGHFRVIDAFSRIVRLGEGLSASGRLSDAAMERALEALAICADKLAIRSGVRARLIATEACRAASNGDEFVARVRERTGLSLEVIDRHTEAKLAVSGCGSLVGPETRGVVLFDIGGGSSEIALVDLSRHRSRRLADDIVAWTSLPVGVVSLAEKFGGRDVTPASFAAMTNHVAELIEAFEGRTMLKAIEADPGFHLLGTSGTVTTLAGIHLRLERYDRRKVDGLWLDGQAVGEITERLLGWSFEERVANACIGADRADLVLAGCAILEAIRRVWPAKRLRVADRGLREGILSDLMASDGVWRRR